MTTVLKSKAFREIMIFSGFALIALLAAHFMADPALATSLIDPSDNPAAISEATGGETSIRDLVQKFVNYFLGFLGFIATIMIIYAGVLYVTDAGSEENVGKAKKIMLYAAIGIIIILISFALVNTILSVTSEDATNTGGGNTTTTTVQ